MNAENLCIYCMNIKSSPSQVCPICQGDPGLYEHEKFRHHLPPYTFLHGQYMLGVSIGEGGFGITYIAYDLVNSRKCAIKELFVAGKVSRMNTRTVLIDTSANGRQFYKACKGKFLQEAEILKSIKDKQGIVDVWDYFEENATAYIVMEYLEGMDLKAYLNLQGGKIPDQVAFKLMRPVLKSMIKINNMGIIHRDISPDNIRFQTDGHVKILDFGSAKMVYGSDPATKLILLKEGFAPPEQYSTGNVGPWMDVYALAATIYRCVTGKVPQAAPGRVSNDTLQMPSELGISVTPGLDEVLRKAMTLNEKNRYQDVWEFYSALKTIYDGNDGSPVGYQDLIADLNRRKNNKVVIVAAASAGGIGDLIFMILALRAPVFMTWLQQIPFLK